MPKYAHKGCIEQKCVHTHTHTETQAVLLKTRKEKLLSAAICWLNSNLQFNKLSSWALPPFSCI